MATGWNQIVQVFTDQGKGLIVILRVMRGHHWILKFLRDLDAMKMKSQVNSTGLQVRINYDMESDTIKAFFLLHYIVLHDNMYKRGDQKVSVLSDLRSKENVVIRMLWFGLPIFSLGSSHISNWSLEIQLQLSQASHPT